MKRNEHFRRLYREPKRAFGPRRLSRSKGIVEPGGRSLQLRFDVPLVLRYASRIMSGSKPQDQKLNPAAPARRIPVDFADDQQLVVALRQGDEAAFLWLINRYHASLVRLATIFVSDEAVAEDVAQETWVGVLRGIDRFEGRSSFKTWLFRILTNIAKTRARRENRSIPFSAFGDLDDEALEPAVGPDRFLPDDHPRWPHHWSIKPTPWEELPEDRALSNEVRQCIETSIQTLPPSQREVITLRDLEGWTSDEVCNVLGISETNQRVLLHRARSKVRRALEGYFKPE
jgi:RNA polymerase sigma-70 factor (ECF subfamily)